MTLKDGESPFTAHGFLGASNSMPDLNLKRALDAQTKLEKAYAQSQDLIKSLKTALEHCECGFYMVGDCNSEANLSKGNSCKRCSALSKAKELGY